MWYSVFGIRYSVFGIRYSVFGIRYSVFGIRYSVFGIRYSVNGNQNQEKTSSLHTREAGHLTSSNLPRRLTIPLAASSRPRR